jgi:hypothetical protein
MGGAVSFVSDAVESVGGAIGDVVEGVGDVAQTVVDEVVQPIANVVENTIKAAEEDPIGTIARVATAVYAPYLLPAVNLASNLSNGQSLETALVNTGISYVSGQAGQYVGSSLNSELLAQGVDPTLATTIAGAAKGATSVGLRGGDASQGALVGGLDAGFNSLTDRAATEINTPKMNEDDLNVSYENPDDYYEPAPLDQSSWDVKPADYSFTGDKSNIPTSGGGLNPAGSYDTLSMDSIMGQAPGMNIMGGASGTSINANTPLGDPNSFINNPNYSTGALGTVSGAGFIDKNAMPALGDPGSFINNPNVTGRPVIPTPSCAYNVNVPNIKASAFLNNGSSGNSGAGGFASLSGVLSPWLNTDAEMLVNRLDPDSMTKTKLREDAIEKKKKEDALYGQDSALLRPQVIDEFASPSSGNFASPSGFASGGTTTCFCLNNDPKYMPKFADCGPSVLPSVISQRRASLRPKELRHFQQYISPMGNIGGLAKGGLPSKYQEAEPHGHNTEFVTGLTGFYACGGGTGQSDDIPAMLHDGDYVMDAEAVSALGDGSSKAGKDVLEGFRSQVPHKDTGGGKPVPAKIADGEYVFPAGFVTALGGGDNKAGAKILDGLREKLREHKRSAPTSKIPPKAKSPLDYIKGAKG